MVQDYREALSFIEKNLTTNLDADRLFARSAYCGLDECSHRDRLGAACTFQDIGDYTQRLYEFMRSVDRLGVTQLYCQRPPEQHRDSPLYAALVDRLLRSSSPKG